MDRNLGALSADPAIEAEKTIGLYYQFGRKDPLIKSDKTYNGNGVKNTKIISTLTKSPVTDFSYSVKYPNIRISTGFEQDWCYQNPYGLSTYWNNPTWYDGRIRVTASSVKSFFDPCPVGWHVPEHGVWNGIFNRNNAKDFDSKGYYFYLSGMIVSETTWYPKTGYNEGVDMTRGGAQTASSINMNSRHYMGFSDFGTSEKNRNESYKSYSIPLRCIQE